MKLTLKELTQQFIDGFVKDTRVNGEEYTYSNSGIEWHGAAIRAAHGGMMPDDTRYKMIVECLESICYSITDTTTQDFDDIEVSENVNSLVDIYNNELLLWLASALSRSFYCDEAAEQGFINEDATMFERISAGQFMEYEEIFYSLIDSIKTEYVNQQSEE